MIVTKTAIPRRAILRGLGATLSLPLLDAMVPALSALEKTAAKPVLRFSTVYVPNGIIMDQWTPMADGTAFDFTPILKPLEPFRQHLLVLSGLDNTGAATRTGKSAGHAQPAGAFMTGIEPLRTTGTALQLGVSMDQIAAKSIGQETPLPSLELCLEGSDTVNGVSTCDPGYSCAYQNTISWSSATTPMPMEANPRTVFERLFGSVDSTNRGVRMAHLRRQRSVLDSVLEKVHALTNRLGRSDRTKLDEYLVSVREVERRIQNAESQSSRELPVVESPAGIPRDYEEHAKLMFDLQTLALQTDMTRVITFQIGREQSGATYPQIGVSDSHHPISHHGGDKQKIANVAKINVYHASLFAYYLKKLESTPDGDGTLLDHSIVLYGSAISDGNLHDHKNLPLVLAGRGDGRLNVGRHLRYAKDTARLTNLQLTLLNKLGVPSDNFGDSTGELKELSNL